MDRLLRAEIRNTQLLKTFDRIYEESLEIWKHELNPKYTTHGQPHTEQVEENLDALTRPLQSSQKPLTEDEIFILLAGACLHDIGMQLIDDPNVRDTHPAGSSDMIQHSFGPHPSNLRRVWLSIEDTNAREAIASVARAHWTEYALPLPSVDWINGNKKGRLRLLGLLLATADLLDLSSVRAHYFRSRNRFFDLSPVSELHHWKHLCVKGFTIGPPNQNIPGQLQFEVEWNDDKELVPVVNDWVMQWFNSQWRKLERPLFEESGGSIQWAQPWAKPVFRPYKNPVPMSPEAQHVLMAERADQIRIDRNDFATRFGAAIKNKEIAVFPFPAESDFDSRWLSRWCEAHARLHACRVAKLDIDPTSLFDPASIIGHLLRQWKEPLPACSVEEAIKALEEFLRRDNGLSLVTIVKTDLQVSASLQSLMSTLMLRNSSSVARVCMLICPEGKAPNAIGDASIIEFDGSLLPQTEIEEYLQKNGYSEPESRAIYERMQTNKLTAHPADVYTYIKSHGIC